MDKNKNNTTDENVDVLVKDCIQLVENAEEIIQCPVCFENSDKIEQCISGHHICFKCKGKLDPTNTCPICRNAYSGTKSFVMSDLLKNFMTLKITLDELKDNMSKSNDTKIEAYRILIKTILTKMSNFLSSTNFTFLKVSKYLQNPNHAEQKEVEMQMLSLTTQLRQVQSFMEGTRDTLISLKK